MLLCAWMPVETGEENELSKYGSRYKTECNTVV